MPNAAEMLIEVNANINAHDYDAVYQHMDPGHRQFINGVLVAESAEATRAFDEPLYALLPDLQRSTEDIFGDDDRAACRSTFTGTMPDGRAIELHVASVMYVRDDKIVESWVYMDPSALS